MRHAIQFYFWFLGISRQESTFICRSQVLTWCRERGKNTQLKLASTNFAESVIQAAAAALEEGEDEEKTKLNYRLRVGEEEEKKSEIRTYEKINRVIKDFIIEFIHLLPTANDFLPWKYHRITTMLMVNCWEHATIPINKAAPRNVMISSMHEIIMDQVLWHYWIYTRLNSRNNIQRDTQTQQESNKRNTTATTFTTNKRKQRPLGMLSGLKASPFTFRPPLFIRL